VALKATNLSSGTNIVISNMGEHGTNNTIHKFNKVPNATINTFTNY
jgi:hypothetical protein